MIALCTHPGRCAELEQAHGDMAAQLADALGAVQQLRAQLVQAQAAAQDWQDAYNGAVEGKAFYEAAFADKCKERTVHA